MSIHPKFDEATLEQLQRLEKHVHWLNGYPLDFLLGWANGQWGWKIEELDQWDDGERW